MALQYGLNNATDFASSKLVSFASVLTRTAGQPMDKSQLWYPLDGKTGLERAQEYAASSSAYVGQEIAVIDVTYEEDGTTVKGTSVTFYGIQDAAGTLKELGSKPLGDDASIAVAEDGTVSIYGFEDAADGTVARKSGGKVTWVPISSIVQGDGNSVVKGGKGVEVTGVAIKDDEGNDTNSIEYTVEAKLSKVEGNLVELKDDGLYVGAPEVVHPEYAVVKAETATEGSQATYYVTKDGVQAGEKIEIPNAPEQVDYTVSVVTTDVEDHSVKHYIFSQCGNEIAHIDIPKDLVVESGTVEVYETAGAWGEPGTYIVLAIANQTDPIYVNAKDLVDIYTVVDTNTVDMTITGTEIKADIKISAEEGNSLVTKGDGLYVGVPDSSNFGVLEVGTGSAGAIQIDETEAQKPKVNLVIATGENAGNVVLEDTVNGLKANVTLPEIPEIPEIAVAENKTAEAPAGNTTNVIALIEASEHTITPTVIEVATKVGLDNTLAEAKKAKKYTYTYNAESNEWSAPTEVDSTIAAVLVPAEVVKNETGTITGGHAGLITPEEKNKLAALVIGEGGGVEISGTISADNVIGLNAKIIDIVTGEGEGKLDIESGAQVNKVENISLPDAVLAVGENKTVNIPYADVTVIDGVTTRTSGVVKGSADINKIDYVDGVGEVNSLSTDKLVQGSMTLVLNAGDVSVTA